MSGLVLPMPEPPADDVAELNELLRSAEHEMAEATMRLAFIRDLIERTAFAPVTRAEQMRRRVMLRVREVAVEAWAEELDQLHAQARAMGLQS